jgi:hypothetical protein
LCAADFHKREDDLKNDLKNTKEKVRSLEVTLREVEAEGQELKRVTKETVDSEYVLTVNFRQPSHEFTFNVGIDLLF